MTPTWVDILESCGYPTDILVLDFETYFDKDYSLKKLSTIEYIEDPRYEEHGVAYLHVPGDPITGSGFATDTSALLHTYQREFGDNLEGCTVCGMNLRFDGTILVRKHNITPPYVVDVLDLAHHLNPRRRCRLEDLCERYGLPAKGDTMQFLGLHWDAGVTVTPDGPPTIYQGMTDEQKQAMHEYACNDAEQEWNLFKLLLPQITRPEFELPLARHTHGLFWHPLLAFDFEGADKLATDMEAKIDEVASQVGHTRKDLSGNISFVKLLQEAMDPERELPELQARLQKIKLQNTRGEFEDSEPSEKDEIRGPMLRSAIQKLEERTASLEVPMKQGKATKTNPSGLIPALAKTDEALLALKKHPSERVRDLIAARQGIKSWPLHVKRVCRMSDQAAAAAGGQLPVSLHYYGAHTGRWTGGEKINLQNLSKRSEDPLILRIRSLLMAPEGHLLVMADASQVEARALAWLAGQQDLVKDFAAGKPVYCIFASEVLDVPIRKVLPDDPPSLAAYLTRYRTLGKTGILGAGYGMGVDRFIDYAKNTYKLEVSYELGKQVIDHYRTKNNKIVRFWRDIEQAFKYVTRYPNDECDLARGLHFRNENDCTFIRLPSGRELRYEGARVEGTGRDEHIKVPNQREENWTYVWGGYLTENVIQALCRDLLAEAMLELETAHGIQIGHHCHDEIIAVVPAEEAEAALELMITTMRQSPEWAAELPLDAEGKISERYGKT